MGDRNDDLKCHICGRAFRLRSSLKVHISTHKRDGILEGKSAEGPNISDRFIQEKSPKLLKNLEGKSVEESSKSDSFIKEETIIKEESLKILEKSFSPKKCQYCEKQFTLRSCLETHIIACKAKSSHCSDVEQKKFPSLKNKSLSTDEKNSPSSDEPEDELFDLTIDMDSQAEDEENLSSGTESSKCKERNSLLTEKPDEKLSTNSIERFKDVNRKIDGQEISKVKGTNHISKMKNKDSTDNGLKIGKLKSTKGKQNVQNQSFLKHKTVYTKLVFQCKICSVSYGLKQSLRNHVLKCHSEKDFKDCVAMELKEIHERIHTSERSYICKTCDKSFTQASHLLQHQILHTGEKPYKCQYCGTSFADQSNLLSHVKNSCKQGRTMESREIGTEETASPNKDDEPDIVFQCIICSVSYAQKQSLRRHVLKCHNEKDFKDCVTTQLKEIHERIHTGERPYICKTCSKSFTQIQHLRQHQILHSGEKPYKCQYCGRSFADPSNLRAHVKKSCKQRRAMESREIGTEKTASPNIVNDLHIRPYEGEQKVKITNSKDDERDTDRTGPVDTDVMSVDEGQEVGETGKIFLCETCGKTFTKKGLLRRHKKYHSSNAKCLTCEKEFVSQSALSKHVDSKKCSGKTVTCKYCSQKYFKKSSLLQHIQNDHTDTEKKFIQCDVCNKLIHRGGLLLHKRTHTGERPFQCDLCGNSFVQKQHLVKHMEVHTKSVFQCKICKHHCKEENILRRHVLKYHIDKTFEECVTIQPTPAKLPGSKKCSYCDKKFDCVAKKIIHERIHTGEKPYKCSFCDKSFRLFQAKQVHERTHTNERPFICETCGKSFRQQAHLIDHQTLHTGEKPHKCQDCGASFAAPSNLRAHVRKNCKRTRTTQSIEIANQEIESSNSFTDLEYIIL